MEELIGADSGITLWMVFAIVGAISGLWWRLEAKFKAIEENRLQLEREFSAYKLHVERTFASSTALEKTESRLIVALNGLSVRVETLISRMEGFRIDLKRRDDDE